MELIILAAGRGSRIFKKINKNKCLIKIDKKTLIKKIVDDAIETKLFKNIKIVVGYKKKNILKEFKNYNIKFIDNKEYKSKEMLHSLKIGILNAKNDVLVTYSDIIYNKKIFRKVSKSKRKNYILPILKNWKKIWNNRKKNILIDCESLIFNRKSFLKDIGEKIVHENEPMGQFMGLFYIPKEKISNTVKLINLCSKNKKIHTTNFINYLVKSKNENVYCLKENNEWYEFDDYDDYKNYFKYK